MRSVPVEALLVENIRWYHHSHGGKMSHLEHTTARSFLLIFQLHCSHLISELSAKSYSNVSTKTKRLEFTI